MCLAATTAVFRALIEPAGLKATLLAVADVAHPDETGEEWSTFAKVEHIAHLAGRGVSTVRADLRQLEGTWLRAMPEWSEAQRRSGAGYARAVARRTYVLDKERILAARDPFFGPPEDWELKLFYGRPPPKVSAGQFEVDPLPPPKISAGSEAQRWRPALNSSTTGAEVQRTGAEVHHRTIEERNLTVLEQSRTPFADHAAATVAVIEAAGLAEGEAAMLRRCRFDAERGLLVAPTETEWRLIRERAGAVIDALSLRLACGPAR